MSNHKNLIFFDKEGGSLNFNYNETTDRFEGDILFHQSSSDIYKTYGLYMMEKVPSFEFESPGELTLNKFQLFNEYGLHFYGTNGLTQSIKSIEIIIFILSGFTVITLRIYTQLEHLLFLINHF